MLPSNSKGGMEVLEIVSVLLRLLAVCVVVCFHMYSRWQNLIGAEHTVQ